jgi:hypothetical protein
MKFNKKGFIVYAQLRLTSYTTTSISSINSSNFGGVWSSGANVIHFFTAVSYEFL